jgi:shikimate dehydrogenase
VANTLVRTSDGWFADNTDVDGVIGALGAAGVRPGSVLLLGGGGTALAVVMALAEMGVDRLTLAGRRPSSTAAAAALAVGLGLTVESCGLDEDTVRSASAEVDLAMVTVPAGTVDYLAAALAPVPAVFDAIYHPWPTTVVAAGAPGRVTVSGLDMLLHQAFRQVELMTGQHAPRAAMRDALAAAVPGAPELRLGA